MSPPVEPPAYPERSQGEIELNEPTSSNATEARFASLDALRQVHVELLKRAQETAEPTFLDEIELFVARVSATGELLDAYADRWAAQTVLDYWLTTLYRAKRSVHGIALHEFDPSLAPELNDRECPYVGLDAFRPSDADRFFGRKRLVEEWLGRLQHDRMLAVIGVSGSGKSSLLMAGLLRLMQVGGLPGSQHWRYLPPIVPGSDPLLALTRFLPYPNERTPEWIQGELERLRRDPQHLVHQLDTANDQPAVVVVDQLEEVFTLCADEQARQAFVDNLVSIAQSEGLQHRVLITMRSDFAPEVARLPAFQALFESSQVNIVPLSAGEIREAIEKPAEHVGLKFEEGIVDELVREILGEPAGLPLLQFTLLKLWQKRERNQVTWHTYHLVGGPREALARSAEELFEELILEQRVTVKRIFLRLARPGAGLEVTSSRVRRDALYETGEDRNRVDAVVRKLVNARLVRLTRGDQSADDQVEVAHEALIRNWPRLVEWLDVERAAMRWLFQVTQAARDWQRADREDGLLYRGTRLVEALEWRREHAGLLNTLEEAFLDAGLALREREQRAALWRRRFVQGAVATLLAVGGLVVVLGLFAASQQQIANEKTSAAATAQALTASAVAARATAVAAQGIAVAAQGIAVAAQATAEAEAARADQQAQFALSRQLAAQALTTDPEHGLLLALQAVAVSTAASGGEPLAAALEALHQAVQDSRLEYRLTDQHGGINAVAYSRAGHRLATGSLDATVVIWDSTRLDSPGRTLNVTSGPVHAIDFSPDGGRIAVAGDMDAEVWDTTSGTMLLRLAGSPGPIKAIAFSHGGLIATGPDVPSIWLWNANTGALIETLASDTDALSLAFSPDGAQLASGHVDGRTLLWDMSTRTPVEVDRQVAGIAALAFNQDGHRLAAGGYVVDLLDLDPGGKPKVQVAGHSGGTNALAFSPDSTRLASGGGDRMVRVWDATTGAQLLTLAGHSDVVWGLAYEPDGNQVASGSQDGTTRIWNVRPLGFHMKPVLDVAFSPDSLQVATSSQDTTVQVRTAMTGEATLRFGAHDGFVYRVAFSPTGVAGAYLATAGGADWRVRVWNATGGKLWEGNHDDEVSDLAFSPDGTQLATGSRDSTARIWDMASQMMRTTPVHDGAWVNGVAFSPDGAMLVTGANDGRLRLWNAANLSTPVAISEPLSHAIWRVAFSPDRRHLATVSTNGEAWIWDASTLSRPQQPLKGGHSGRANAVAFSPDGSLIATAGDDRTVKLWDATSGDLRLTLTHSAVVNAVAFSPDGKLLATGGDERQFHVYRLQPRDLIAFAQDRVTRALTSAECQTYLPLLPDLPCATGAPR